jgi:glucose-1-phosphate thymidylyltransferase
VIQQLQAVYDKPMIYYPLTVLIAAGIREFCFISDPPSLPVFKNPLGSSNNLGINIDYRNRPGPKALPRRF